MAQDAVGASVQFGEFAQGELRSVDFDHGGLSMIQGSGKTGQVQLGRPAQFFVEGGQRRFQLGGQPQIGSAVG